jgi:hypothetical protein
MAFKLSKDKLLKRGYLVLCTRDYENVVNIYKNNAASKRIYKYAQISLK